MAYDNKGNKISRQEAVGLQDLVKQFLKEAHMSEGMNRQRIAEVWNEISGAGRYTLDTYYDKCVLYCTLNSSMVRNQLYFQRDVLVRSMNDALKKDELFIWDWQKGNCIKSLVLK